MGTEFSDGFAPVDRVAFPCRPRDKRGEFYRPKVHRNGAREQPGMLADVCRVRYVYASKYPGEAISKSESGSCDDVSFVRSKRGSVFSKCLTLYPPRRSSTA